MRSQSVATSAAEMSEPGRLNLYSTPSNDRWPIRINTKSSSGGLLGHLPERFAHASLRCIPAAQRENVDVTSAAFQQLIEIVSHGREPLFVIRLPTETGCGDVICSGATAYGCSKENAQHEHECRTAKRIECGVSHHTPLAPQQPLRKTNRISTRKMMGISQSSFVSRIVMPALE